MPAADPAEPPDATDPVAAAVLLVDTVQRIGTALASELELERVVQLVTDEATALAGAQVGAFFYNVHDPARGGEAYTLYTLAGAPPEQFAHFPHHPRATPVFGPTFRGEGVVRSDDITADPRYGHMPPHHGMPAGHMPVRSYLAVPVRSRRGEVLGGLFFGHERPGVFTEREERLVTAVAAWAAVAMDNARLYAAERRARAAAEAAAGRAERLRALAVALADAVTEAEVGARVMHDGVAAFGAYAGVIAVPVEGGAALEVTHSVGYPAAACMDVGRRWPTTLAIPIAEAYRTGTPVFVESPEAWAARYAQGTRGPSYRPPPTSRSAAWAALPLAGGRDEGAEREGAPAAVRGVLLWTFDEPRTFDAAERQVLAGLAAQCAQALERARLHAAEAAARRAAEAANRAKSDFLAVMSHELRTPLNAIAGYAQLLEMGLHGPVTGPQRDALARVQRSQRHLLGLINDVLNYAKLEAGRVDYRLAPVALADAVADLAPMIEPQLAAKGLRFSVDVAAGAVAHADREKLAQVLLNLLSNAVKFTPEGGAVTVEARCAGATVLIAVRDTGVGVPADKLATIFEPFVQVAQGLNRPHEGTGLGLAISRELARGMGGDLLVTSALDAGSVFTLVLPTAAAATAVAPSTVARPVSAAHG
jgi:signal transduction histidine kinase